MARRRRHEDDHTRDAIAVSSPRPRQAAFDLLATLVTRAVPAPVKPDRTALQDMEDRREFHPDRYRKAQATIRSATQLVPRDDGVASHSGPAAYVGFRRPSKVGVCVRRHQRKEVLHALRKTGRGGGRKRNARWNEHSDVRC